MEKKAEIYQNTPSLEYNCKYVNIQKLRDTMVILEYQMQIYVNIQKLLKSSTLVILENQMQIYVNIQKLRGYSGDLGILLHICEYPET